LGGFTPINFFLGVPIRGILVIKVPDGPNFLLFNSTLGITSFGYFIPKFFKKRLFSGLL